MLSYASKFPWKICNNPVSTNHEAVEYDKCDIWVHIKCSKINTQTYNNLEKESYSWYCIYCSAKIFPFSNVNEDNFHETIYGKEIKLLTITEKKKKKPKRGNTYWKIQWCYRQRGPWKLFILFSC